MPMTMSTTPTLQNRRIKEYCGIVVGEAMFHKSGMYPPADKEVARSVRATAMEEMEKSARDMRADAVVGVSFDYEILSEEGGSINTMMVTVSGTAVKTADISQGMGG